MVKIGGPVLALGDERPRHEAIRAAALLGPDARDRLFGDGCIGHAFRSGKRDACAICHDSSVNGVTDESSRERRERWWRSSFLILATVYVLLLLISLVVRILDGFIQIAIVLFVAWLLAFVLSPVVAWLQARRRISRGMAIAIAYIATLLGSGFLLFYAASSIGASAAEMAEDYPWSEQTSR